MQTPTDPVIRTRATALDSIRLAQQLFQRDHSRGLARLNKLFRAGTVPDPPLDGRYAGEFIVLDIAPGLTQLSQAIASVWMPWQGKTFHAAQSRGDNILTRDSLTLARLTWPLYRGCVDDRPETYRGFAFRTYVAPGRSDPDRLVLKIDYDVNGNPRWSVRRVLDELVQIADDLYLGKAHLHWWWGAWQVVAYFALSPERLGRPVTELSPNTV